MGEIVIDKSYLDGAPASSVQHLCDHHVLLMPHVLFFELMTTSKESQKRCFGKLPNCHNPLTLIPDIRLLLRFEREHRSPCVPLSQHHFVGDYLFNRNLRDGTFVFEGKDLQYLNEWQTQVKNDTQDFITLCLTVHHFFPEVNGIEWKDFPDMIARARRKIAEDYDFVRDIYTSFLDSENALPDALEPSLLDPRWAYFRWLQCKILAALRVFERYQGHLPPNQGEKFWRKMEHSMLDVYYVILGSLAKAVASNDDEVCKDFLMVCPDGELVSSAVTQTSSAQFCTISG